MKEDKTDGLFGAPRPSPEVIDKTIKKLLEPKQNIDSKAIKKPGAPTSLEGINLKDYIFLPKHDLYVAKTTSHGNKSGYDAHSALHQEKARMLTIREYFDFREVLQSGQVHDGLGNLVKETEVRAIYNNIMEKRNPWRGEWLDAAFKVIDSKCHVNYYHQTIDGKLISEKSEELKTCLMEEGYVDFFSTNEQGLPTSFSLINIKNLLYFFPPANNGSFARFDVDKSGPFLDCRWPAEKKYPELKVRAAREKR